MSYKKPDGLLLAKPIKRIEPKSSFLKKLEAFQAAQKPKLEKQDEFIDCIIHFGRGRK